MGVDHMDRTLTFASLKENPNHASGDHGQLGGHIAREGGGNGGSWRDYTTRPQVPMRLTDSGRIGRI